MPCVSPADSGEPVGSGRAHGNELRCLGLSAHGGADATHRARGLSDGAHRLVRLITLRSFSPSIVVLEKGPDPSEAEALILGIGKNVDGQVVLAGHAVGAPLHAAFGHVREVGTGGRDLAGRVRDHDEHLARAAAGSPQEVVVVAAGDRGKRAGRSEQGKGARLAVVRGARRAAVPGPRFSAWSTLSSYQGLGWAFPVVISLRRLPFTSRPQALEQLS